MQSDHGIHILYDKTLRAKEYTQNLVYDALMDSFQKLPSYSYTLQRENSRMVTRIQTNEENIIEYFFMALGPYITWFTLCRPEVAIDGTHLKGKYKGVLYVAAVMDGNEQICLLLLVLGIWRIIEDANGFWMNCVMLLDVLEI